MPANQITVLDPGAGFVHRNIANVLAHTDMNALSVIEYAVKALGVKHLVELMKYDDTGKRIDRLCELNVIEQVKNVCHTSIVQQAWRNDLELSVHGWIYGLNDCLLHDLGVCIKGPDRLDVVCRLENVPTV